MYCLCWFNLKKMTSYAKIVVRFAFLLLLLCKSSVEDQVEETLLKNSIQYGDYYKLMTQLANKDMNGTIGVWPLIQMFDATCKGFNGLSNGNPFCVGNFELCNNIEGVTSESEKFHGKYCLGRLLFTDIVNCITNGSPQNEPETRLANLGPQYVGLYWAVCMPDIIDLNNQSGPCFRFDQDFCYSKTTEQELSVGAIVTIAVLATFLAIVVCSTAYDVFLYFNKKKPSHDLLIAFSYLSNGRKLLSFSSNPNQLLCLNGIKAMSMIWVVIGHIYMLAPLGLLSNFLDYRDTAEDTAYMFIVGAGVSVDTFFAVGGLLTVYTFMNAMEKGVKFNIFMFYLHRILRLTPAFGITILVHYNLINYMGNGPLWKIVDKTLVEPCRTSWWTSILYIANYQKYFGDSYQDCPPQTWYLSIDTQLFFLSPIVLLTLKRSTKIGMWLLGCLIVLGCVVPGVADWLYQLTPNDAKYMDLMYKQTYTRFGPYVIGMATGYIIFKTRKSKTPIDIHPHYVCALWLIALTGLTACVYAGKDIQTLFPSPYYDKWGNIMFLAFNRNAWAVAMSIIIFLCVTGHGGPINTFLGVPIFQFLSKVSYSIYLVHYGFITMRLGSMKEQLQYTDFNFFHLFWGDFMFSLGIAIVLCLTFESPVIILEKFLFGKR